LSEIDPVFAQVGLAFFWIELESHGLKNIPLLYCCQEGVLYKKYNTVFF